MDKRGQSVFGMSFGMIFSIILIVVVIAVAFFVISYFLNLGKCTDTSILYDELQEEIDIAWKSSIYQGIFEGKLPSGTSSVCFGRLDLPASIKADEIKKEELINFGDIKSKHNIYIYPPSKACSYELSSHRLDNVDINEFFCLEKKDNFLKVKLSKGAADSLVKII